MTLPSSGSLSYNSIRAEFGSPSSNVQLSLYVRGRVYTTYLSQNSSIPTSSTAQISVSNFYGAEGASNYFFGTGGSHNSGGKVAIQYYGIGGPSLPAAQSTSIKIGSLNTTMTAFYTSSLPIDTFQMQFATATHNNSNLTLRTFTAYNTSASSLGAYTTSSHDGTTTGSPEQPTTTGSYSSMNSSITFSVFGGTQPVNGFAAPNNSSLNQYFWVKAF